MSFLYSRNGKQMKCNLCCFKTSVKQITILINCKHNICNSCLQDSFTNNWASILKCPIEKCDKLMENAERENIWRWILPNLEPVADQSNVSTGGKKSKKSALHVDTTKDVEVSNYYPKILSQMKDSIPEIQKKEIVCPLSSSDKLYRQLSEAVIEDSLDLTGLLDRKQTENLQSGAATISKPKKVRRQNDYKKNEGRGTITTVINKKSSNVFNRKVKNSLQCSDTAVNQNSLNNHDEATFEKKSLDDMRHKPSHSKPSQSLENSCDRTKITLPKELGVESLIRLQKHIKEKNNKVVDLMFVALESDLAINTIAEICLICQEQIRTYEGIIFPHCSRSFCRTCLIQPHRQTELADEIIVLYSNSSNNSKNCAIVLNAEIRSLLQDSKRFAQFQEDYVLNTTAVEPKNDIFCSGYVKNPDAKKVSLTPTKPSSNPKQYDTRSDVVLLRNSSNSSCSTCNNCIEAEEGVILRDCCHVVCDICLIDTIMATLDYGVEVSCPSTLDYGQRCATIVQEREIKRLLTEKQYEKYERKCLEVAQGEFDINVNCFNTNCNGWIIIEGYKDSFDCPVCFRKNCLACKVDHHGRTCNTYQTELGEALSIKTNLATTKSRPLGSTMPNRETRNCSSKKYDQY